MDAGPVMSPRPIRAGEEPTAHALIDRCYREYGLVLNLEDACEAHLASPGEYFRSRGGEFWVVTDDAGLVRATAAMAVREEQGERIAELKSMYVDAAWRRRGMGRRLVEHVIDAAREAGCGSIELWSDTRFEAAHRLYESVGFARCCRREVEDSNDSAEWGYRLTIERASERDIEMMRRALALAREAASAGEAPIGCIVYETASGRVLAEARNNREASKDPTGHAEVIAIRAAARALGDWRLNGCTLAVTLEPCTMCAGAIVNARVGRVVYGAADPKAGAARSLFRLLEDPRLNHRITPIAGVLAGESAAMLREFFRQRREQ